MGERAKIIHKNGMLLYANGGGGIYLLQWDRMMSKMRQSNSLFTNSSDIKKEDDE